MPEKKAPSRPRKSASSPKSSAKKPRKTRTTTAKPKAPKVVEQAPEPELPTDEFIGIEVPTAEPQEEQLQRRGLVSALGLFFLELIKIVALAAITIGIVRYFLIQPFYVKGKSMEPTFYEHEYLIIDKITYRIREWRDQENDVRRGDVVVLRAPNNPKEHYLKRVIGLPGERIKIAENRVIIYNEAHPQGLVLKETYVESSATGGSQTLTLGPEQYYVLGDNRGASFDSRRFGPVERDEIIGRTWFRGWPLTRISTFDSPEYAD